MAYELPDTGYLRLRQIIGDPRAKPPIPPIIPVSKSTWWAGVKSRRYPQPVRTLGTRITAWRAAVPAGSSHIPSGETQGTYIAA